MKKAAAVAAKASTFKEKRMEPCTLTAEFNATKAVYDSEAEAWHRGRIRTLYEKKWLDPFEAKLPAKGLLLDLGCGTGDPIGSYFLAQGYEVTGVDYAPGMIDIAQKHFPEGTWLVQDMTALNLPSCFAGIYSWDGFFHLTRRDQRALLPKLAELLIPGGTLLLTVGDENGEITGTVAGKPVYHASLSTVEYETVLRKSGFNDVISIPNDGSHLGRFVLMASKG